MIREEHTYKEALDYLFKQLPMFQRVGPKAFKKDLTNIIQLVDYLGNPHLKFKSIHIAGTNGKGSTAHILAAVLQAHGLKTGLYTSPHYRDFRERIKIDGSLIREEEVIKFVQTHKDFIESLKPSFFEISVAMAFDYFSRQEVDIAVIETGLGGRLDSTNILTPLLSIITNISYDHQDFLGDTLALIAGEKAGIIKRHVPVVVGETHPETEMVFFRKALEQHSPLIFADQHISATLKNKTVDQSEYEIHQDDELLFEQLSVGLVGSFQAKNIQTAIQALLALEEHWRSFELRETKLRNGLKDIQELTKFLGRWQILGQDPLIIADSAHNEGGLKLALGQLKSLEFKQLHIIMGVVFDKKLEKVLTLFPTNAHYYFAKADIPRGLEAEKLKTRAKPFGLVGDAYSSVEEALNAAKKNALPEDVIYVGGSVFVVAEVL